MAVVVFKVVISATIFLNSTVAICHLTLNEQVHVAAAQQNKASGALSQRHRLGESAHSLLL